MENIHDVIIIGGGPGGIASAVYAKRLGLDLKIIHMDVGGNVNNTDKIDNFIGIADLTGQQLASQLEEQEAKILDEDDIVFDMVELVDKSTDGMFTVTTSGDEYKARNVILATGATPRKLGIPGEEENSGRGVSYCAICDGPFFKGKRVAVIGGGDSALQEALLLTKFTEHVDLIVRKNKPRAQDVLVKEAEANDKITFITNTNTTEILNNGTVVDRLVTKHTDGTIKTVGEDGVFIYIGMLPNLPELGSGITVRQDNNGFIETDKVVYTDTKGLFVIGDLRADSERQISTAISDGTIASITIANGEE